MSDFNMTLNFIAKRDKIVEMLNISIAVLFLELSIYEKTIESSLLGDGEKDEMKKFRISSLISTLEEELENKRKSIFSIVKTLTENECSLENPKKMSHETITLLDNGDINWFGNIITSALASESEKELAKDLQLPINPLCMYKHDKDSHLLCRAYYDRTFPTTFRFCNKEECDGCHLARLPSIRDKNKLYISDDDLQKIIEGIELYCE